MFITFYSFYTNFDHRIFEFGDLGNMDPSLPYVSPIPETVKPPKQSTLLPQPKPKVAVDALPPLKKPTNDAERAQLARRYIELLDAGYDEDELKALLKPPPSEHVSSTTTTTITTTASSPSEPSGTIQNPVTSPESEAPPTFDISTPEGQAALQAFLRQQGGSVRMSSAAVVPGAGESDPTSNVGQAAAGGDGAAGQGGAAGTPGEGEAGAAGAELSPEDQAAIAAVIAGASAQPPKPQRSQAELQEQFVRSSFLSFYYLLRFLFFHLLHPRARQMQAEARRRIAERVKAVCITFVVSSSHLSPRMLKSVNGIGLNRTSA